ncbi:Tripartite tricarboxylate transporter family receptor [compost metagenome]
MERLSREVIKALESSDYRQRLTSLGVDPWPGTPPEMTELLRSETKRYAEIVRAAGIPRDKN